MEKNKKLLILVDDRGQFYSSTKEPGGSMDTDLIARKFEDRGYSALIKGFSEIEFTKENYSDFLVLYQSTEDPGLKYKDYIEDVLLGLGMSGAKLVPRFEYFRAHHNKVFMEILRRNMDFGKSISSSCFGTPEELIKSKCEFSYPVVVKPGAGSRSLGVSLAHNRKQLLRAASKISRSPALINIIRAARSIINLRPYKHVSNHRQKFIVQEYVPGLSGDCKILVYGDRYYVVKRENRPDDFRASGSGRLSFPKAVSSELLDYAQLIFEKSVSPFMGMNIADSDNGYFLLEFQFVIMGNYALEKSSFYFKKVLSEWALVEESSLLEDVFVNSVDMYINKKTSHATT